MSKPVRIDVLQDDTGSTCLATRRPTAPVLKGGEEHHRGVSQRMEGAARLQAVPVVAVDVQQDNVGRALAEQLCRFFQASRRPDQLQSPRFGGPCL
jgi:hypothetical protein